VYGVDLAHDRANTLGADIDHSNPSALVGEQVSSRPTHSRGGAGDDRHLAADRA
jgi:hypothetical protein